jgi:lipopolysaccharide export system protein LptA
MRRLLVPLMLIALTPALARAQGRNCELLPSEGFGANLLNVFGRGTPNEMAFIGGGARFACDGGLRIRSDSAAHYASLGRIEFIGRVHYQDSVKTLTSDYVQYYGRERHVVAQGNVVLTDRDQGSQIISPFMDYYQKSESRSEDLVQILSGRPRAVMVNRAKDEAGVPGAPDTTVVVSDAMEIYGSSRFNARGNVEITRGDVSGFGSHAVFEDDGQRMKLSGAARVEAEKFKLAGDTIDGTMTGRDRLREVTAVGDGRLDGEDLNVEAPRVRVEFDSAGDVERLVAVGNRPRRAPPPVTHAADSIGARPDLVQDPPPPGAGIPPGTTSPPTQQQLASVIGTPVNPSPPGAPTAEGVQARARSKDFRIVSDSIDARAPKQELEKVIAIGDAYGERLGDDLANAEIPAVISRDWMKGDTIIAEFAENPEAAADTTAPARLLEKITAMGLASAPAVSLYRIANRDRPEAKPAINYLVAQRITVALAAGEVSTVEAHGEIRGLYLAPPDSTAAAPVRNVAESRSR